ncbi:MAG: GtrA family protein [Burkholderiaceae bacterium]
MDHTARWNQFTRYAAVGAGSTALHYAVLLLLVEHWLISPPRAAALGTLLGAVTAYAGNRRFTFNSRTAAQSLPRFMLIAVASSAITAAALWVGTHLLAMNYLLVQGLATLLVLMLGFSLNARWSFA